MRRPSVLFMNRMYPPSRGATGRILRDLARSFAREGWHVTVITTGPQKVRERDGGIRVIRLKGPEKPGGMFGYIWIWLRMLVAALRLPRRHLLVTMTDPPLLVVAGYLVSKIKGGHHIHWCQDLYPDVLPALGYKFPGFLLELFKRLSLRAFRACDKVIVIGRCMARHFTLDGIDPKRITVIPNWPELELLKPSGKNPFNGASWDMTDVNGYRSYDDLLKHGPKFRVLYAGNIGQAHPMQTILDAAEILNHEHPEIEFVFVGDGPQFDMLARQRSERRLDNIRLLPYQPLNRLRDLMESGDVHLISMKNEAAGCLVPSKLYAALAVKRPSIFIGPPHSETAKVITDFNAGLIVPQGDARALAEAVKHYRLNGEDWFAAHNGAASAGQIFVPKESINAWIERAWHVVEEDLRA